MRILSAAGAELIDKIVDCCGSKTEKCRIAKLGTLTKLSDW